MIKHVCIRDCYYNARYWSIGEVIEDTAGFEDMPPNKHFAELGGRLPADAMPIIIAGDDPRSTNKIRAELKAKHDIKMPKDASRKVLFAAWVEAEKGAGNDAGTKEPAKTEGTRDINKPVAPSDFGKITKLVGDMSPDEIDDITKRELAQRLDVSFTSYKKAELIEKAIDAGV